MSLEAGKVEAQPEKAKESRKGLKPGTDNGVKELTIRNLEQRSCRVHWSSCRKPRIKATDGAKKSVAGRYLALSTLLEIDPRGSLPRSCK